MKPDGRSDQAGLFTCAPRVLIVIGEGNDGGSTARFGQISRLPRDKHIQCFALLVANHRSQVGRVRQFGFDLYRLASGTGGKAYDVRTNPKSLSKALEDVRTRLRLSGVACAGVAAGLHNEDIRAKSSHWVFDAFATVAPCVAVG